jgi:hypothetical protein
MKILTRSTTLALKPRKNKRKIIIAKLGLTSRTVSVFFIIISFYHNKALNGLLNGRAE